MSKYCNSEELQVFRKHFYDLTIAIQDPDTLAVRLYSEGIITESVRDNVIIQQLPKQLKCTILAIAMETSLKLKPSNFTAFIGILRSDRTLWPIAGLLTNKCMELQTQNVAPDIRIPGREMSEPNPTKMEFSKVKEHFAYAMTDVVIILHREEDALARLVVAMDHLQLKEAKEVKPLMPGQYDKATSVREFFKLLSPYYGCLDCELVRILVRATQCQPAIDRLQKYLDYLAKVASDTSLLDPSTEDHHDDTPKTEEDTSESTEATSQDQSSPVAPVDVVKQKPGFPDVAQEGSTVEEFCQESSPTPEPQPSAAEAQSASPSPLAVVTAKVDKDEFTAKDYEETTTCLSNLWELPRLAFKYMSAKKNCVVVKWQIPSSLLPLIQSVQVTDEDYKYLASHSITEVRIDDCYSLTVPALAHSNPETGGTTSEDAGRSDASLSAPQTETEPHESDSTESKKLEAHLLTMSKRGNLEEVQRLIKSGVRVDCTDESGRTPLLWASAYGHLGVVECLVRAGANVNIPDQVNGFLPLEVASEGGHLKTVEYLISHGAVVNSQNQQGRSPLHAASQHGHPSVVEVLIGAGATVDLQMKDGTTPLMTASLNGHASVVGLLIHAGADIDLKDEDGTTPLMTASLNGHASVVGLLIHAGADINLKDENGFSPLDSAAQEGHVQIVQMLVDAGASVNTQNQEGRSPLHAASQNGHPSVVEILIGAGATVDLQGKNGQSPLFVASKKGHASIVQKLIDAGASVDLQEKSGRSPLLEASFNGHSEVCRVLIDAKADVNLKDKEGASPLGTASFEGHSEVCRVLIDAKADVNLKDENGGSPLHVASQEGHKVVVQQLIDSGAAVNSQSNNGLSPLMLASWNGHTHVVDLLIKSGAHTDLRTVLSGWNALWLACRHGHIEVAKILICSGADLNLADQDGFTPVMIAAQNKNREIIELLAGAHADLNIKEKKSGRTALMLAAMEGDLDTVRLLISAGADASITDQNDSTAADIAQAHSHKEVYQELIAHTKASHTIPIQEQEVTEVSTDTKPEVKEFKTEPAPEREMKADHEADPERAQMKAEPTAETEVKADPLTQATKGLEAYPITGEVKKVEAKKEVDKNTAESDKKERIKQTSNYLQSLRQKMEYKLQQLLSTTGVIPRRKGTPAKGTTRGKVATEVTLIEMDT